MGEEAEKATNIRLFAGDLRKKLTITNLLSATIDAFERVDILVNASRQVMTTDPLDPDDTSMDELLQQNMLTAMRVSQAGGTPNDQTSRDRWRTDDRVDREHLVYRVTAHPC
jgi:Short-chain dehydrogenases of various substrate specificities